MSSIFKKAGNMTRKLKKIFTSQHERPYTRLVNMNTKNIDSFKGAGSVFTNGTHILGGYQPRKRKPFISGIGGKKEEGETFSDTAIRETLEEIFEFDSIPKDLINEINKKVVPTKIIQNGNYIMVVYTFEDLERILTIVKKFNLKSLLYDSIPTTLLDLMFKRNITYESKNLFYKPEISHLSLLPVVEHKLENPFVDTFFIEDMPMLMK